VRSADDGMTAPAAVSEELAALGPFFAVEVRGGDSGGPAASEAPPPAASWRPMSELVDGSVVLNGRVEAVRAFLATGTGQEASAVELRVAASVVHLGLVARVLSPLLALAALHQRRDDIHAADLWWQPTLGSMFPLSVREAALGSDAVFTGRVVFAGSVIDEFSTAIARFGVNEHILRGNVASALAAAARTLSEARPELRDDIHALISPHLSGSGSFSSDGTTFRRRTCCLIYRAAPDREGALCGDCALAPDRGPMDT
jgi:hypothetical protein